MIYVLLVSIAIATIIAFLPNRKDFAASCADLMDRMPATHYEDLCGYISSEAKGHDEDFWNVSHRFAGLFMRIYVSFLCIRLVEAFLREGRIPKDIARLIWGKMAAQIIYTLIAVPEAAACRILRDTRHIAARESLRFYCELLLETNVACVTNRAPECVFRLPELL